MNFYDEDTVEILRAINNVQKCVRRVKRINDSRAKRSTARPGRATAWEIREVLGMPHNLTPSQEYEGRVSKNGDVVVTNRITGRVMGSLTNEDLNQRALNSKLNITPPMRGGGGANIPNSYVGNRNNNYNTGGSNALVILNGLSKSLSMVAQIVGILGTLGAGVVGMKQMMSSAKELSSDIKQSMNKNK